MRRRALCGPIPSKCNLLWVVRVTPQDQRARQGHKFEELRRELKRRSPRGRQAAGSHRWPPPRIKYLNCFINFFASSLKKFNLI